MLQNLTQNKTLLIAASALVILGLILILIVGLRGSNAGQTAPTATINLSDVQTAAVSTFAFDLTQTAESQPTATPSDTPLPTYTPFVIELSGTPLSGGPGITPTASCYGLKFISDVTVPDHTVMAPGQTFTKTWLVQNTGTCAWQSGFKWNLILGDAMGGSTLTLDQSVAPGAQDQLSVPMVAPAGKTGSDQGWWRMSDANGTYFGESPWVLIDISAQPTTSATATTGANTATATSTTPTATATSNP